jgi:hypothetical protein
MARQHGKDIRVYLGGRDASDDLMSIDVKASVEVHDSTTFAAGGDKRFDIGLRSWTADVEAFYQPGTGGIGQQLEAIGSDAAGVGVLSIYDDDADAIGDTGILGSEAIFKSRGQPIRINDLIKLSGSLEGNGRLGLIGKLLHPHGSETVSFNGGSLDNGASSANGGRGSVHVTAVTGTWTLKVQHSTDNSVWSDLITFTAFSAAGAQTIEVTGTVNRYLRIIGTEDAAGTITFVGGFARY